MGLAYANLDAETRKLMVEEIDIAIADGSIYRSSYLTERGLADWDGLLKAAASTGTDDTLAAELRKAGRIRETTERRKPSGGHTTVRVPYTAAETMAEGELNRFYCRAICRRAITLGVRPIVYRAKQVMQPRPESEAKLGTSVDPKAILNDLRTSPGVEPALGLPPGPNSGLTLRLP